MLTSHTRCRANYRYAARRLHQIAAVRTPDSGALSVKACPETMHRAFLSCPKIVSMRDVLMGLLRPAAVGAAAQSGESCLL